MGLKHPRKPRTIARDESGIAPFIALMITMLVIGAIGVSALGVYQFTQKPNVTYNISDTGFSLAGLDLGNSIYIIIGIIVVFAIIFFMMRKPSNP
jgi:hypothetical protein